MTQAPDKTASTARATPGLKPKLKIIGFLCNW